MKTLSLFLFGLILACSNTSENSTHASVEYLADYDAEMLDRSYEISEKTITQPVEVQQQKIIKTGNFRFESRDLENTHRQITALVNRYQGFVSSDRSGKGYNEDFRSMTIRVPSQHFQTMVDSISRGVSYFDQNEITQRDVTEEFIDIEARLKAKRELENRYLELLKQAKNVKEMLEIERELSTIREEIEARQGRLNYLQNQVSYSTLNIHVYKRTTDRGITTSYGQKMWNAIKSGWNGISLFFLGLLHIWPFFVILLLAVFGVRKYLKRKKKI
jgi:DNA-binding FrmR family transcriptional regulator